MYLRSQVPFFSVDGERKHINKCISFSFQANWRQIVSRAVSKTFGSINKYEKKEEQQQIEPKEEDYFSMYLFACVSLTWGQGLLV